MRKVTAVLAALVSTLMMVSPASAQGLAADEDTEKVEGAFYYTTVQDPMTDKDRSFISTIEEEEEDAVLAWKCASDGLNIWYLGDYLAGDSDNEIRARYRIGNQDPSDHHYWRLASSHEVAYMPMDRVETVTAQAEKNGERIVLRVIDPYDGETRTHVFPIDGLSSALQRLSCYEG